MYRFFITFSTPIFTIDFICDCCVVCAVNGELGVDNFDTSHAQLRKGGWGGEGGWRGEEKEGGGEPADDILSICIEFNFAPNPNII